MNGCSSPPEREKDKQHETVRQLGSPGLCLAWPMRKAVKRTAAEEKKTTFTLPCRHASRTFCVPACDVSSILAICALVRIWSQPADSARCMQASQPFTSSCVHTVEKKQDSEHRW